MADVAADLVGKFTEVFSTYVEQRLREQGLERPATLAAAVEAGEIWLRETLEELMALPPNQQRRGPLEVFQEAMRFPTEALAAAGVETIARDPGAVAAIPGDIYNLAPASSRLLGEELWRAHLAWGAAKARALDQPPVVGLLSRNLLDRSRVEPLVVESGRRLAIWDGRGSDYPWPEPPKLVMVDLTVPDVERAIERLTQAGVRVVAFGPHGDRVALRRAKNAGADEVLARSAFFAKLGDLLG